MINKENYIEYIVDYFDGNLSDDLQNKLLAFLDENPECKEEFDNYSAALEETFVEEIEAPASLKATLKNIPEAQEEKLVAYMENDLSAEERNVIETELVENSEMRRSLYLFEKTKLEPEMDVVFPKKAAVKRYFIPPMVRRTMVAVTSAAAILLLFWNIVGTGKTYQSDQNLVSHMSVAPSFIDQLPVFADINEDEEPDTTKTNSTNTVIETPGHQGTEVMQSIPLIAYAGELSAPQGNAESGISDVRTEYLEIYSYKEYKLRKDDTNNEKPKNKLGTFSDWTNWAMQTVSGEKSLADNPANQLSASDVSNFGIQTLSRITGADIPLAVK
ncbi:MAG: hypothetical protein C0592_07455 [Marinilabiliales bacterium]|nr:MAG: hypothetical protein C0592_07455 [Marinilabiliales bacterium]